MKVNEILIKTKNCLRQLEIENPQLNAELIIAHFCKIKRLELNLFTNKAISEDIINLIEEAVKRRIDHEPIQYILGETEFYGYKILVNNSVLIPRPETELLVEKIIEKEEKIENILEIGTGSGAIAIALAKNLNYVHISATDISKIALETARYNAKINNTEINFFNSDIFEKVNNQYDLIVSNPPYIPKQDFVELPIEVRDYEPYTALVAEDHGLSFYNKILSNAKEYLTKSGTIYFEIGYDQAEKIVEIANRNGFNKIEVFKDLNGFDRIVRISIKK